MRSHPLSVLELGIVRVHLDQHRFHGAADALRVVVEHRTVLVHELALGDGTRGDGENGAIEALLLPHVHMTVLVHLDDDLTHDTRAAVLRLGNLGLLPQDEHFVAEAVVHDDVVELAVQSSGCTGVQVENPLLTLIQGDGDVLITEVVRQNSLCIASRNNRSHNSFLPFPFVALLGLNLACYFVDDIKLCFFKHHLLSIARWIFSPLSF